MKHNKVENDLIADLIIRWQNQLPHLDTIGTESTARIVRLNHFISRKVDCNLAQYQLNIGEFDVLAALLRESHPHQLTPGCLQSLVMISSGGLTNRIDRLEARQLIIRLPDKNDRRSVIIQLTEKGKQLITSVIPTHLNVEKQFVGALNPEEQKQLSLLLKKLMLSHENK